MKKILVYFIFSIIIVSISSFLLAPQEKDYKKNWNEVEAFVKKGLPQSALKIVDEVYQTAKDEGNQPQLLKALIYRVSLQSRFEEDHLIKSIQTFENELQSSGAPEKQILHSLLAEMYHWYYAENRWQINDRSTVTESTDDDIHTWDAVKLNRMIRDHYFASLENNETLEEIKLNRFSPILQHADSSNFTLWPTLYDLLGNRALNYFSSGDAGFSHIGSYTLLNDRNLFLPAREFIKLTLSQIDTSSNEYITLSLYQHLLKIHLDQKNTEALVDLDLKRLQFIRDNTPQNKNSEKVYIEALIILRDDYRDHPAFVKITIPLAKAYRNQGAKYEPLKGDSYRWEINKAMEICQEAIEAFPGAKEVVACKNIINEIKSKTINIKLSTAELPGAPLLAYVEFRNNTKLYFRVVQLDPDEILNSGKREDQSERIRKLLQKTVVNEWSQNLPDTKDHQQHATEIIIPTLNSGYYMVLASGNPEFTDESIVVYEPVWITNLSYLAKNNDVDGSLDLYVLDRESGYPVENVLITVYDKVYNSTIRGNEFKELSRYTTNDLGYINIPVTGKSQFGSIMFTLEKEGDRLFSQGARGIYKQKKITARKTKTYLFTDRAIYRPGQTVYFKGIVVDKNKNNVVLNTTHKTSVTLFDVNRKEVSSLDVKTNEFGSYHGAFVIPQGSLNGQMRLKTKTGSLNFQVEEYKRPTFSVKLDTIKGEYKLGEEVTITGKAENFAGSALMNANVKFRVVRSIIAMPYYWEYHRYPLVEEQEIAHGQVISNIDGSFEIMFVAESGSDISSLKHIPYNFTIYTDVMDITGEVQSAITHVTVGSQSMILNIEGANIIQKEATSGLQLTAKNLSGAAVDASVQLSVFRLTPTGRLLNKRYWPQPDINLIPQEDFVEQFPRAVYKDEDDKNKWQREQVFSQDVEFNGEVLVLSDLLKNSKPGEYMVVASLITDANDTIKTEKQINLFSTETKQLAGHDINWSHITKTKAEPGDIIQLVVGSAAKKTKLYYEIANGHEVVESDWLMLNRSQKVLEIPVKESYRGNFEITTVMVRYNRVYVKSFTIEVPFTNKKLDISIVTHRDFLTPGKEEEWQVKISGPDGQQLASELMAGMYDASLDQFRPNQWRLNLYNQKPGTSRWGYGYFQYATARHLNRVRVDYVSVKPSLYPEINWFGYQRYGRPFLRGVGYDRGVDQFADAVTMGEPGEADQKSSGVGELKVVDADEESKSQVPPVEDSQTIPVRTNFNETAFFYPQLRTDSAGNVIFSFTTPDALTEWKMLLLAHSEDLKTGTLEKRIKAHKDLMIIPNLPRFVRQGDRLVFSAKVVNFTDEDLSAKALIEFFNPITLKPIEILTIGQTASKELEIKAKQSVLADWEILIPFDLDMIAYRVKAVSETFTDGEERMIPVLTNRMLVTETLPMPVNGNETKEFTFEKLVNTGKFMMASTMKNFRFTVEFTSNPAWYAVQALPYLSTPKIENAGNLFRSYYTNSLSAFIVNSNPKIKNVFESWKQHTPDAFFSNLQKNQELKNTVMNATPWVLEAENESEQKRRIGILFDMNRLAGEKNNTFEKLKKLQLSNGAWSWFNGMREDRHTTQNIVVGLAKLRAKGVLDLNSDAQLKQMLRKAVIFIDGEIQRDFEKLKKKNPKGMKNNNLGSIQIEYLYARTLLIELFPLPQKSQEAFDYYVGQEKNYWLKKSNYLQGMIALTLNKLGHRNESEGIMRSLKERSLYNEEMGMYWRQERSWFWYQAPVESQAIIIEAFDQIMNDQKSVERMKIWLLKQKQTSHWKTSSATAEAVYALLLTGGDDFLAGDQLAQVKVGDEQIIPKKIEGMKVEAGTGYFKTSWSGEEVKPRMGIIEVANPNSHIAWGAAYWQYFENLDRITAHDSPLSIEKKVFIEELTDEGPVVKPLEEGQSLRTGDKVVIRLVIRTDRNIEYVEVKDMRATALEPMNQLSGYSYKGGLGFYKNITDVSTEFFIRYLNKGTYVLEYPLMVTQKGEFSNGIASIQSYYAPEFAAHSEGLRLVVK